MSKASSAAPTCRAKCRAMKSPRRSARRAPGSTKPQDGPQRGASRLRVFPVALRDFFKSHAKAQRREEENLTQRHKGRAPAVACRAATPTLAEKGRTKSGQSLPKKGESNVSDATDLSVSLCEIIREQIGRAHV